MALDYRKCAQDIFSHPGGKENLGKRRSLFHSEFLYLAADGYSFSS